MAYFYFSYDGTGNFVLASEPAFLFFFAFHFLYCLVWFMAL